MAKDELCREVDAHQENLTIDVFEHRGSTGSPAGWKVRVIGYDGKSPMPSRFDLLPGGDSAASCKTLFDETVAKCRAEGWSRELSADGLARIRARVAKERALEEARTAEIERRLKAFPVSDLDRRLAQAIANPAKVEVLDLRARGDQKLTAIPPTVKRLASLTVLNVSGNGLKALPEEIGNCKELRELHLGDNEVVEIPFKVWSLKKLEILDAHRNKLRSIWAKPKTAMRLEIAGNPLRPAVQDLLTRSTIGDFRKISHLGVDTDCIFPIDFTHFEVSYPGVKALPTQAVDLYGRVPTAEELDTLATLGRVSI